MKLIKHNGLRISKSNIHGFGVFTDVKIKSGDLVEQCPTLILHNTKADLIHPSLQNYVYQYIMDGKSIPIVPLGWGGIYNHSDNQNLNYKAEYLIVQDENKLVFNFWANRDIEVGEELFVNYGKEYFNYFNINKI